jgi:hypothetical protein
VRLDGLVRRCATPPLEDGKMPTREEELWEILDRTIDAYDKTGKKIGMREYHKLKWETPGYFLIYRDWIREYEISTVWLGINHQFWQKGPPLIFETMVFKGEEREALDDFTKHYSTEEEAEEGHLTTMVQVQEKFGEGER